MSALEAVTDAAYGMQVLTAQLNAGRDACKLLAGAGHDGERWNCQACRVLRAARKAGLWQPAGAPGKRPGSRPNGRRTSRASSAAPIRQRGAEAP